MENDLSEMGILLVDDEAQTLKYFRRAFEKQFRIFTATSADEGIGILQENSESIAILITDQRMPEKRGVELLKYAKNEYSDIVRILTTGYTDLEEAIDAVNSGEIHRYITKPWDLSALQLELRQSMQFFLIRRERDELLREKLSARQRLEGLNRIRELVTMASGFTATQHPLLAVQLFIEQIPVTTDNLSGKSLSGWNQVISDIEKISTICSSVAEALEARGAKPFTSVSLDALFLKPIFKESGKTLTVEVGELGPATVEANLELLELAFGAILDWVSNASDSGGIVVSCQDQDDQLRIQLQVEGGDWGKTTILDFPAGLLGAYFVCAHHLGSLMIGTQKDGVFTISVELPKKHSGNQPEASPDLSWLERVLPKFENW